MRLTSHRYPPLSDAELTAEQKEALAPLAARGPVKNIYRTLAHNADALKAFMAWGSYVLSRRNSLPARERELVILRVGYLCRSGYEWAQHREIGLRAGLTEAEVERIKTGPDAGGWSAADQALLSAADELCRDQFIGEATWTALARAFDDRRRMDVVFTVTQYIQVSIILNTFGVQLEDGQAIDPDLKAY